MAIPNNSLSSLLMAGLFLPPDDLENSFLIDFESGGIGLSDPSAGLRYQTWVLKLVGDDVIISAATWPEQILFTLPGITEISLAFDQNMKPFVAFVENGVAKFWWFDTNISATKFSTLPANSRSPRCCIDDKRQTQTNSSDIILTYVTGSNKLAFRQQRDRYEVEHILASDVAGRVIKVGMNHVNRLQWLMQDPV